MTHAARPAPPLGVTDSPGGRVEVVDGLRGIAALLVVVFHLHEAISRTAEHWLWAPLGYVASHGYLGVDVFFVISGFVIALSVSRAEPSFSYLGRFVLRRSIRLDPPYWTAIALELLLMLATTWLFPDRPVVWPSAAQIGAHVFYLQELLGYGSIIVIFWTLCYEIQFYVFYVLLMVVRERLPSVLRGPGPMLMGAAALFALSLWTRYWPPSWLPQGLAVNRWFQFYLGVLTWRTTVEPGRVRGLVIAWCVTAAAIVFSGAPLDQLLAIGISALVLSGVRSPDVARWLTVRPLLALGTISYSLYLFHSSIGWRFVSLIQLKFPGPWSAPSALAVFALAAAVSIGASAVLWWSVERPLLRFSRRVRLPLRTDAPGVTVAR